MGFLAYLLELFGVTSAKYSKFLGATSTQGRLGLPGWEGDFAVCHLVVRQDHKVPSNNWLVGSLQVLNLATLPLLKHATVCTLFVSVTLGLDRVGFPLLLNCAEPRNVLGNLRGSADLLSLQLQPARG